MIWLLFRTSPQLHPKASGFSALGSVVAQAKINLVIFKRFFFVLLTKSSTSICRWINGLSPLHV